MCGDIEKVTGLFHLCPAIFKRHSTVKDKYTGSRVQVHAEVTGAFELEFFAGFGVGEGWFEITICKHIQRVRVNDGVDIISHIWVLNRKQLLV